jgi:hypothetical protein
VVVSFDGNYVGVRRVDGSLVTSSVSPFHSVLHGYAASSQWDDALRLCRFIKVLKFTRFSEFHELAKHVNFSHKIQVTDYEHYIIYARHKRRLAAASSIIVAFYCTRF